MHTEDSLVDECIGVATEREITLQSVCTPEIEQLNIIMQGDDFETALLNLISNALKFTPTHGKVTVLAQQSANKELIISVTDTGRGLTEEQQKHLFERYYTTDDHNHYGQTGLGLSLVQTIMQGCNGSVIVESTPDEGSTFTLTFPKALLTLLPSTTFHKQFITELGKQYTSELTEDTAVIPQYVPAKGPHILIVDDNRDMCTYLASLLAPTYQIHCAHRGSEALTLAAETPVSLIICDIMMPEMDGHEVLANIRSHYPTASIPVIFLTARDSIEEQAASLQEGVVHYLTKPFQPQVLLATIETVLEHDREVASAQIAQLRSRIDAAFDDVQQQTVALPTEAIHRFAKDHHLSEREEEILHLIASGNSDKEIAATLGLSHRTIASHNQRIYQKAEVRGRYELISSIYAK